MERQMVCAHAVIVFVCAFENNRAVYERRSAPRIYTREREREKEERGVRKEEGEEKNEREREEVF